MISRAELDALFAEDDRRRAEHREWLAERQAQAQALVQRNSGDAGLVLKTTDNALLPAPQPEPAPFDEATSTAPNFFDDVERNEEFADTMAVLLNELRKEWQRDHAVEIAELRGQISALLTIVGQKASNVPDGNNAKSADIVDLPAGFIRRRNDAA
jgi:hypothetical protein